MKIMFVFDHVKKICSDDVDWQLAWLKPFHEEIPSVTLLIAKSEELPKKKLWK